MENIEKTENKNYELAFLAKTEEGAKVVLRLLKQHQFNITSEGPVKKIALAYKIKNESQGNFGFFHATGSPEALSALNHDLGINPEVLRFLIITPPFIKQKTSSLSSKPIRTKAPSAKIEPEAKIGAPLSNEALEKKIEEILQ